MERLWTRPFIQLTLSLLFLFTGFYLLLPLLPLYVKQLGGSDSQVGLVGGVFTLAAVLFRPVAGGLLDLHGRRPFVIWGMVLFAISMYLYGSVAAVSVVSAVTVLLVLRVVHGASWAFSTTAAGTAITDVIPVARRGEGMGWYGMAMTVAMAVGPMLGLWALDRFAARGSFTLATGLSLVALVLAFATDMPFQRRGSQQKMELFAKDLLPIMAAIAFLTVAYGGVATFLPLFAEDLQVNSGLFFLVYAGALTVVRPLAGTWSDRRGEAFVIIPATAITAAALLVLSFSTGLGGIIAAAILYGVGFGSAQPALQAAALRLVSPQRTGVANASYFTSFDLGIGLGSIALGWVSQLLGYRTLFIVSAVGVLISLAIFAYYVRPQLKLPAVASANATGHHDDEAEPDPVGGGT